MDATNILKPALARGENCALLVTTIRRISKNIFERKTLERRFKKMIEPDTEVPFRFTWYRKIRNTS
jgi:ATP-dependent Clp protease ATP-binding subunit ClpA